MSKFWTYIGIVDRYVAPIYRILWVTAAVVTGVSAIAYFLFSTVPAAFNWIDARWVDIGPQITPPSKEQRLLLSLVAGQITGFLFIFTRISAVQRARIHLHEELSRCVQAHIKYYDAMFTMMTDDSIDKSMAVKWISELSRNHSIFLCSRLAEIFELITYCPCHASIKSFNPDLGLVTTRTRDALSHNRNRAVVDEHLNSYDYKKNTAFSKIIDEEDANYYVNNSLLFTAFMGRYNNANREWKKIYRAVVVMPVTINKNPANITANTVIGFVCVDNMCGRFNRRYATAVMSVFVSLITDMMVKLGEIEAPIAIGDTV